MSTNSFIAIINADKSVDAIYCHNDGYPSHQVPTLVNNYNSEEKARALIALGDLSYLGDKIAPTGDSHSFSRPEDNTVVAYNRDRDEDWESVKPKHYETRNAFLDEVKGTYTYVYHTAKNRWYRAYGRTLKPLV